MSRRGVHFGGFVTNHVSSTVAIGASTIVPKWLEGVRMIHAKLWIYQRVLCCAELCIQDIYETLPVS
jgi:hypothetical protein